MAVTKPIFWRSRMTRLLSIDSTGRGRGRRRGIDVESARDDVGLGEPGAFELAHDGMPPASGWTTPAMILISIDLPAPFSPSTAWILPRSQAKSTLEGA